MLVYKTTIKDTEKIWCSLLILDKIDFNAKKSTVMNKESCYHDQRFASPGRYNKSIFVHDK